MIRYEGVIQGCTYLPWLLMGSVERLDAAQRMDPSFSSGGEHFVSRKCSVTLTGAKSVVT